MRLLVCGGRDLDPMKVWDWLEANAHETACDALGRAQHVPFEVLIHGGASGADEGAAQWAAASEIQILRFPADWKAHGRSADPRRNARMLAEGKPDLVIAFPGGSGTADMVGRARGADVPVVRVEG